MRILVLVVVTVKVVMVCTMMVCSHVVGLLMQNIDTYLIKVNDFSSRGWMKREHLKEY